MFAVDAIPVSTAPKIASVRSPVGTYRLDKGVCAEKLALTLSSCDSRSSPGRIGSFTKTSASRSQALMLAQWRSQMRRDL